MDLIYVTTCGCRFNAIIFCHENDHEYCSQSPDSAPETYDATWNNSSSVLESHVNIHICCVYHPVLQLDLCRRSLAPAPALFQRFLRL